MGNQVFLSFNVWKFDDMTHDEISSYLGLTPSRIFVKGAKKMPEFPKSTRVWPYHGWIYEASEDKTVPFEDQLTTLLGIIESKPERFKTLCEKYGCEFSIGLYLYAEESTPYIVVNQRAIKLMQYLDIEMVQEIYMMGESDETTTD